MSVPEPQLPHDLVDHPTKPLLGPLFWTLVAFGLLCIVAGVGVALVGPKLAPIKPAPPPAATVSQVYATPPEAAQQALAGCVQTLDAFRRHQRGRTQRTADALQIGPTQVQARVPGQEPP